MKYRAEIPHIERMELFRQDILDMISDHDTLGIGWDRIAEDRGVKPESLRRRLNRRGFPEYARQVRKECGGA